MKGSFIGKMLLLLACFAAAKAMILLRCEKNLEYI